MVILQKIKELRKAKGFSQKYMADRLELSNSGYAKIESGDNVLSVERLLDILKILDVKSYNQVLPAINNDLTEEIEKALINGSQAFEQIHHTSNYVQKLLEQVVIKFKKTSHPDSEEIIVDLELIKSFFVSIDMSTTKHGFAFRYAKDLIEKID